MVKELIDIKLLKKQNARKNKVRLYYYEKLFTKRVVITHRETTPLNKIQIYAESVHTEIFEVYI